MVSKRIGVALLASVAMVGCFEGDLGNLVFDTNLVADGGEWNPDLWVADGQVAAFAAIEGTDDEELPLLESRAGGGLETLFTEDNTIGVTGAGTRGKVSFDGAFTDHFRVRFAAPDHLAWVVHPGLDPFDELALLEGAEVPLNVALRDRRGRTLGFAPDSLEVVAEGATSAWIDPHAHSVRVAADQAGPSDVVIVLAGEALPTPPISVVTHDEVVETTTDEICAYGPMGRHCTDVVLGWTADGVAVLGL